MIQRSFVEFIHRIDVGSSKDQQFCHFCTALFGRTMQGRLAEHVYGVNISPGGYKHLGVID